MDRTEQLDRVYGLLVTLDETSPEPCADLMDAFNVFSQMHQPAVLLLPDSGSFERHLNQTVALLAELIASAADLCEALDLYAARDLVDAVIREPRP